MKREGEIVRRIIKAVKERYPHSWVTKLSDRFRRGLPDVLILYRGRPPILGDTKRYPVGVLFVEAKTETGKTSAIQDAALETIADLKLSGLSVMVARSPEEVIEELKQRGAC